ncbi:MAG: tetratricopeptide repeat protein [Planctomycetes bacterium]|nr:tetratricopeptide repeat protein [Planctomycetota bacterium]
MDTVTYPDPNVAQFIEENIIPLRVRFDDPLAEEFGLTWTPTLVTLDPQGKEHQRTVGFLPPEELIPSLMLGIAKSHFECEDYGDALSMLQAILTSYPGSGAAPEAVFLQGVAGYKRTHSAQPLKAAYEKLRARYPQSEWAKRAAPYRLL